MTIPPAMIDGEKIVSDADLKNLLQKYPGTERLYIPPAAGMNPPRDGDGLCDIMGKLLLASDIDQVPVFHFT